MCTENYERQKVEPWEIGRLVKILLERHSWLTIELLAQKIEKTPEQVKEYIKAYYQHMKGS